MSRSVVAGARKGAPRGLLRALAQVVPPQLETFVLPGLDVARASGLHLEAAGLRSVASPRHAIVLLIVGELPEPLLDAATVAYAQMPRPRAIVALGAPSIAPLPTPDAAAPPNQEGLEVAIERVRQLLRVGAWSENAEPFEADVLVPKRKKRRKKKAPEGQRDPHATGGEHRGDSSKSGVAVDAMAGMQHDGAKHDGMQQADPKQGTHHREMQHSGMQHDDTTKQAATKQGSMQQDAKQGEMQHGGMKHGGMGGGMPMGFMSMVRLTQHLPRGRDGLPMERVQAPFGPFFAGLPSGLALTLWLDGDTVARAEVAADLLSSELEQDLAGDVEGVPERLARLDPLAPSSYRQLAKRVLGAALPDASKAPFGLGHVTAVEFARVASHLNWLAGFGHLLGYTWLERQAAAWHLKLRGCRDVAHLAAFEPGLLNFLRRVQRTPLLSQRLAGIGRLTGDELEGVSGPIARASGLERDARLDDSLYRSLAFQPVVRGNGDALARLSVRLEEIHRSVALTLAAHRSAGNEGAAAAEPTAIETGTPSTAEAGSPPSMASAASLTRAANVETPRGVASLRLRTNDGQVVEAELDTPSTAAIQLVERVAVGLELADALIAVASLDISPWEAAR